MFAEEWGLALILTNSLHRLFLEWDIITKSISIDKSGGNFAHY